MIIVNCVSIPISCLLTVGSMPVQHSVLIVSFLNVKELVGTFNQKTLLGAFSVIVKTSPINRLQL